MSDIAAKLASLRKACSRKKGLKAAMGSLADGALIIQKQASNLNDEERSKLINPLNKDLIPLYVAYPQQTVDLIASIISHVYGTQLSTFLTRQQISEKQKAAQKFWEDVLDLGTMEGLQNYMQHPEANRLVIANGLYHILCPMLYQNSSEKLGSVLKQQICVVLIDSSRDQKENKSKLRDSTVLGGTRLGEAIVKANDYLYLDSLLSLACQLAPRGREVAARKQFVKETFRNPSMENAFGSKTTQEMEETLIHPLKDGAVTVLELLRILGDSSETKPQLFPTTELKFPAKAVTFNIYQGHLFFDETSIRLSIPDPEDEQITDAVEIRFEALIQIRLRHAENGREYITIELCLRSPPSQLLRMRAEIFRDNSPIIATFNTPASAYLKMKRVLNSRGLTKKTRDFIRMIEQEASHPRLKRSKMSNASEALEFVEGPGPTNISCTEIPGGLISAESKRQDVERLLSDTSDWAEDYSHLQNSLPVIGTPTELAQTRPTETNAILPEFGVNKTTQNVVMINRTTSLPAQTTPPPFKSSPLSKSPDHCTPPNYSPNGGHIHARHAKVLDGYYPKKNPHTELEHSRDSIAAPGITPSSTTPVITTRSGLKRKLFECSSHDSNTMPRTPSNRGDGQMHKRSCSYGSIQEAHSSSANRTTLVAPVRTYRKRRYVPKVAPISAIPTSPVTRKSARNNQVRAGRQSPSKTAIIPTNHENHPKVIQQSNSTTQSQISSLANALKDDAALRPLPSNDVDEVDLREYANFSTSEQELEKPPKTPHPKKTTSKPTLSQVKAKPTPNPSVAMVFQPVQMGLTRDPALSIDTKIQDCSNEILRHSGCSLGLSSQSDKIPSVSVDLSPVVHPLATLESRPLLGPMLFGVQKQSHHVIFSPSPVLLREKIFLNHLNKTIDTPKAPPMPKPSHLSSKSPSRNHNRAIMGRRNRQDLLPDTSDLTVDQEGSNFPKQSIKGVNRDECSEIVKHLDLIRDVIVSKIRTKFDGVRYNIRVVRDTTFEHARSGLGHNLAEKAKHQIQISNFASSLFHQRNTIEVHFRETMKVNNSIGTKIRESIREHDGFVMKMSRQLPEDIFGVYGNAFGE